MKAKLWGENRVSSGGVGSGTWSARNLVGTPHNPGEKTLISVPVLHISVTAGARVLQH